MRKIYLFSTLVLTLFWGMISHAQKLSGQFCSVGDGSGSTDRFSNINRIINSSRLIDPDGVIIIPVVFHVIYNINSPEQNISDVRIINQLNRLNTDFRKLNSDISSVPSVWAGLATDMKIEFRLACVAPNGSSTNGIERLSTNIVGFSLMSAKLADLGGLNAWDTDTYLNIWVCDSESGGDGRFPWEYTGTTPHPITNLPIPNSLLDGVVLNYRIVDNANYPDRTLSRIGVHEVGHWLGLWHTYQFGCAIGSYGDEVADTPPQQSINTGCPTFPLVNPICNQTASGEMFMNFMDQASDQCKYMFTNGQRDRVRAFFSQNPPLNPWTGATQFSRYPFLNNYFGIKPFASIPHNVVNNTITVQLKNPACLPTTYTLTGPATEISHNNQQILLSVPCNSNGTITVTATAGNYIDDYTFTFTNTSICIDYWPKVYYANATPTLSTNGSNNFLANVSHAGNLSQNINHVGPLPSPAAVFNTLHYTGGGITNWAKPDLIPLIFLNSGIVQMGQYDLFGNIISIGYYNGVTGALTSGPALVPANEIILAETNNGGFITRDNNYNIYIHSPTGNSPPLNVGGIYNRVQFNPNSNMLFVWTASQVIMVYEVINSNFNLRRSRSFSPATLLQVDNQDIVYLVKDNILQEYFYLTNIYQPVSISGFVNSDISYLWTTAPYTQDKCMFYKASEAKIYAIDLAITPHIAKYISVDVSSISIEMMSFLFDGNDVYISSLVNNNGGMLGTQAIPELPIVPVYTSYFITKMSLNDFQSRGNGENYLARIISVGNTRVTGKHGILQNQVVEKKDLNRPGKINRIQIYNTIGQIVLNLTNEASFYDLIVRNKITGIPAGVYIIKVINKDNSCQVLKINIW